MTGSGSNQFGWRYWTVMVTMPFATVFLTISGYAILHGYLDVPEARLYDDFGGVILEAIGWIAAVIVPQSVVVLLIYKLDAGILFSAQARDESRSIGGTPAGIAGLCALVITLLLWRAVFAADLFAGSAFTVLMLLSVLQGLIVSPLVDFGEARLLKGTDKQ